MRLAAVAPGSAAGKCPDGNTGRTRAGLTTPMPIPDDLAALLRHAGVALRPVLTTGDHRHPVQTGVPVGEQLSFL
ncbi:DUF3703 domain-containing protein [Streptomyces albidoflavus]|uniref:DUF3703 domain-containing protein n=1 Tax=Streptomyces albidoflavus TaxID=1886 RepID=UPI0033F0F340